MPTADGRKRIFLAEVSPLPLTTGWFDPAPKGGGALRRAAESYLAAKGDPGVRLPGLRRGDLVAWDGSRVTAVNGAAPDGLEQRPEFAQLGAVHPSRPLVLETASPSSARVADIQRTFDLVCPLGFGQRALIVSPPKAG
jgi:transcription termination factor Rho